MASNSDGKDTDKLIRDKIDELLKKDFGRLVIEKHECNLYIALTDKVKVKI